MSETALAKTNQDFGSLEKSEAKALIKDQLCPKATDGELELFFHQCVRTGLDPMARQIYPIMRWDKRAGREVMQPQTSIDGFRVIAERSGKYAGQLGPWWCDEEGNWTDVWLKKENPTAAKVAVLRQDFQEPLWAVAKWDEYVQTTKEGKPSGLWRKMGANQLAKCAESLALRKAFPNDMSGLYTREEMQQAEVVEEQQGESRPAFDPDQSQAAAASNPREDMRRQMAERGNRQDGEDDVTDVPFEESEGQQTQAEPDAQPAEQSGDHDRSDKVTKAINEHWPSEVPSKEQYVKELVENQGKSKEEVQKLTSAWINVHYGEGQKWSDLKADHKREMLAAARAGVLEPPF